MGAGDGSDQLLAVEEHRDDLVGVRMVSVVYFASHLAEELGAAIIELDVDDPRTGGLIGADEGIVQVVARQADAAVGIRGQTSDVADRTAALTTEKLELGSLTNEPLGVVDTPGRLIGDDSTHFGFKEGTERLALGGIECNVGGDAEPVAAAAFHIIPIALPGDDAAELGDIGVVGELDGHDGARSPGQLNDDPVVAETLDYRFLGTIKVDAIADDA